MIRAAVALALLLACGGSERAVSHTSALTAPTKRVSVVDFGAVGDGATDARVALQAALDAGAGGVVFIPNGTYLLTQKPGCYCALALGAQHAGTVIRGESRDGVILRSAPGAGPSQQLIYLTGAADVTFDSLTLDGDRVHQTVDPHRAGLFVKQSPRLGLYHVTSRGFTGDGAEIYDGSHDPIAYDVLMTSNGRNGLTLGGGTHGGVFMASQFTSNVAQQFDSEGGPHGPPIDGVTVTGCLFDALGASNDFVLTMTGTGPDTQSKDWTVTGNTVNGAALMVWIKNVVYARNHGVNPSTKPSLYVYRNVDDSWIYGNEMASTGRNADGTSGIIHIVGTGLGQAATVHVVGNRLSTAQPQFGITAICARTVEISDNVITGAGAAHYDAGVYLRTTRVEEPMRDVIIRRNAVTNFGLRGVLINGNGLAWIDRVLIASNTFGDTAAGAMAIALDLDADGTHAARDVTTYGNTISGGTTTMMIHPPAGTLRLFGLESRWAP